TTRGSREGRPILVSPPFIGCARGAGKARLITSTPVEPDRRKHAGPRNYREEGLRHAERPQGQIGPPARRKDQRAGSPVPGAERRGHQGQDGRAEGAGGGRRKPRTRAAGSLRQLPRGGAAGARAARLRRAAHGRSEEHTSELQSRENLVCRLLLEKKKKK